MASMSDTSFNSSVTSTSNVEQQEKDVSKVFNRIRAQLQAKEKELLELQRANSSLLAPDSHQIESILDHIGTLHLSTQEGHFAFASIAPSEPSPMTTCVLRSSGMDSIKVLPSNVWLSPSSTPEQVERRLPMVTHLLSLPAKAYISSSSSPSAPAVSPPPTVVKDDEPPSNRLPMVNQILSMPIDAFISSSSTRTVPPNTADSNTNDPKTKQVTVAESTTSSILQANSVYSKDYWLRKSSTTNKDSSSTISSEVIPMDLEAHIEECSVKMRRLHAEYLAALEKLGSL